MGNNLYCDTILIVQTSADLNATLDCRFIHWISKFSGSTYESCWNAGNLLSEKIIWTVGPHSHNVACTWTDYFIISYKNWLAWWRHVWSSFFSLKLLH